MAATRSPPKAGELDADRLPWLVVRVFKGSRAHRATGHAAEMAFFAILTLVPSTVAVGAALGVFKQVLGADLVSRAEDAVTEAVRTIMGPEIADDAITPF